MLIGRNSHPFRSTFAAGRWLRENSPSSASGTGPIAGRWSAGSPLPGKNLSDLVPHQLVWGYTSSRTSGVFPLGSISPVLWIARLQSSSNQKQDRRELGPSDRACPGHCFPCGLTYRGRIPFANQRREATPRLCEVTGLRPPLLGTSALLSALIRISASHSELEQLFLAVVGTFSRVEVFSLASCFPRQPRP